jgi:glucans biosynthesis protein C
MNDNIKSDTDRNLNNALKIKRYDYLDNIKWVLAIIVIVFHSAITAESAKFNNIGYNLPDVIKSMQWQYHILDNFTGIFASFFMSLFFFISAYFVVPSSNRKGAGRFILDKLKRLGIPTLIMVFILTPIIGFIIGWKTYLDVLNLYGSMLKTGNMELGVTWFCWTLIVFSVIFVLLQKIFFPKGSKSGEKKFPPIWKILLFAVIMIPINYLGLYLQHLLGENFLGFHLLGCFPAYIVMFYFGIQAYKYKWLDQLTFKHAFCGILMWIFGRIIIGQIAVGYGLNYDMAGRGFTVIGMCLFLIYAFKMLFNTKNKWTAILSRTAFAAYVVQQVPMALIAGIYTPYMTQTPIVNFIVIAIPSVISSFLIGYVICKLPLLRKIF